MKNSDYWKERFTVLEAASHSYGQQTYSQIEKAFIQAQQDIQKEIDAWYARFAANNRVSLLDAKKMLNSRQLAELKWDVNQYIQYGRQNAIDGKWMKQLENASARFHITRLEALQLRTQQALEKAFGNELDDVDKMARHILTEDYYQSIFEVQRGLNIGWNIGQIKESDLEKVITKPWAADGKNFSDRIWQKKNEMVTQLHQELTRTLILGKAPDKAIKHLEQFVDQSVKSAKYAASRLVMTEQAYFHSVSQKKAFEELDVEEYEIVATLDGHTCGVCADMDGQHFPMKNYEAGVTAPPFHPNCRSVTAPYFEDNYGGMRAARDKDGKTYYVPDNMTYKDWKKTVVDGEGLTRGEESDIMKMGKVKGDHSQLLPDFSKYHISDEPESVSKLKTFISSELNVPEAKIKLDGLKNIEVAKPFFERLGKIRKECGLNISGIISSDVIDGDVCCIACYKPFEDTLYISNRYFNSQDALLDTLKTWANNGIMPKQCTTIQFIAEHEAAHIRIPDEILKSDEAKKIFKKRNLKNQNDKDIFEYYADAVAIFRMGSNINDNNLNRVIEYLRKAGIKV